MPPRSWISKIVLFATCVLSGAPGFALESVLTLDEAKALLGDGVVGEPLPDMPLPDPPSLLQTFP